MGEEVPRAYPVIWPMRAASARCAEAPLLGRAELPIRVRLLDSPHVVEAVLICCSADRVGQCTGRGTSSEQGSLEEGTVSLNPRGRPRAKTEYASALPPDLARLRTLQTWPNYTPAEGRAALRTRGDGPAFEGVERRGPASRADQSGRGSWHGSWPSAPWWLRSRSWGSRAVWSTARRADREPRRRPRPGPRPTVPSAPGRSAPPRPPGTTSSV